MTADRTGEDRGPLPLVGAAAVALAGVLAVLWWTGIGRRSGPPPVPPRKLVATTARAWARSWERGDVVRLGRLTTVAAPTLGPTVEAFDSGLDSPGLTATATQVRVVDDDHATARVEVSADLFGLGAWRYDTTLHLARTTRGEGD